MYARAVLRRRFEKKSRAYMYARAFLVMAALEAATALTPCPLYKSASPRVETFAMG